MQPPLTAPTKFGFTIHAKRKNTFGLFVTWKQVVYTLNINDIDSRLSKSINYNVE